MPKSFTVVLLALAGAAACSSTGSEKAAPIQTVEASIAPESFSAAKCGTGFETLELDHVVPLRQPETAFDANGAGVALGDLNDDGMVDIVLGNLAGPIQVFWNRGDMRFEPESLGSGRARAVQLVDVDGDGDLDVVVASGFAPPLVFANQLVSDVGPGQGFQAVALPGVTAPAYSMLWFDPDRDGDLDAVIASYDMEFGRVVAGEYVSDAEHGVWFLERSTSGWAQTQLAPTSHALAMTTVDLDGDSFDDLIVGNDYGLEDGVWLWKDRWEAAPDLLPVTAANTMSFDIGDLDVDGDLDLYATDMAPYDESNQDFWSAMTSMNHDPPGPQLVENVLVDLGDEQLTNSAAELNIAATGWSWSGRLADFDNDHDLDLYVANGMLPSPLFPVFPSGELEETNLAYRNLGIEDTENSGAQESVQFQVADDWGLDSTASTRGVAVADLDGDGDLDIVTSTVDSPAQIFVNGLCDGSSIIVDPRGPDGARALGATVTVATSAGIQSRSIKSGIGYLSADPATAHFGLGVEEIDWIAVEWPDGERTVVDDATPGRLRVTRITEAD